jgi:hypothetical protein
MRPIAIRTPYSVEAYRRNHGAVFIVKASHRNGLSACFAREGSASRTAAALEAHRQHTRNAHGNVRQRITQFGRLDTLVGGIDV